LMVATRTGLMVATRTGLMVAIRSGEGWLTVMQLAQTGQPFRAATQ